MKPSKLDDILLILFVLNSLRESGYDVRLKLKMKLNREFSLINYLFQIC